jgi:hypothetical protein
MLTRREFIVAGAAVTASTAFDARAQPPAPSAKPNILFIVADDLGWVTLAATGGRTTRRLCSTIWQRTASDSRRRTRTHPRAAQLASASSRVDTRIACRWGYTTRSRQVFPSDSHRSIRRSRAC